MGVLHAARENARDVKWMGSRFLLRHVSSWCRNSDPTIVEIRDVGSIEIRRDSADLGVVREIFREQQYRIPSAAHEQRVADAYAAMLGRSKKPLIIDAGANNGASAVWFAARYPEATIVAIEPDPANAALCRRNTARFDVDVREAAIGSLGGRVRITGDGSASDAVRTDRSVEGKVPIMTVDDIVALKGERHELFIVKVDIEGFERDLFASNTDWVGQVAALYVEPHDYLFPGEAVTRGLQTTMAALDFEVLVSRENLVYVRRSAVG